MEELLKAIASSGLTERVSLLPQALEHGESGIDFLIECLEDSELEIRATAYQLLQDIELDRVRKAILSGFLLNPGNKIYYVLKSDIYFEDHSYRLYPSVNTNKTKHLVTYDDYREQGYKVISFGDIVYINTHSFSDCYLNFQQAELQVESLRRSLIQNKSITEFDLKRGRESAQQWCDRHQITQEVNNFKLDENLEKRWQKQQYYFNISNSNDYINWFKIEEYLKSVQNLSLLNQLWQDLVGCLTGVNEIIFEQKTYLNINNYYSELIEHIKNLEYADDRGDLYSEEAEINLLLTALNNSKLEIRSFAYQLLQGINSEKAQQAIHQGVKLKPGDKIYSVYQSGISYTDEIYFYLHDDIDYLMQLLIQIENDDDYDYREYAQRIYCYTDKQQAAEAAEILHRKLIHSIKVPLEWYKENPDFDAKQWCLEHEIIYDDEWDKYKYNWEKNSYNAILKIKSLISDNENLMDDFRRSRYIYHPQHMDQWCKDNQIYDQQNQDIWHSYTKLLNFLELTENIELLSKFWKDGSGNFAFFKEEIVQQTAYVKVGHQLDYQSGEDKLFALPQEYKAKAGKLLLEVLENKKTDQSSRSKARKMLQELDWNEIPF